MDHHIGRTNVTFVDTGGGDARIADRLVRTANLGLYIDSNFSQNLDRVEVRAVRLRDCPAVR